LGFVPDPVAIREGQLADAPLLLRLFDEAVDWLVVRGQPGQWGGEPFSRRPAAIARVQDLAGGGGLRVAELDGQPVGALVVGSAPGYAPPIDSSELYILLLLTSRLHVGRKFGSELVQVAIDEARAASRELVRVDCWAGAPGLIAWYQRQGFTPTDSFEVKRWRGQILEMPLSVVEWPR
jgi:GNAT superfamily N-acetyltransferase